MGLPRTFVGFSGTDINYYRMMCAWNKNKRINFDFVDCQLTDEINSENEAYIKSKCRARINMAGTFVMLIGEDTRYKHNVKWEAEVAIEQRCRVIGVNLNDKRTFDRERCPPIIRDIGAIFVPFSARLLARAIQGWRMKERRNWHYNPEVYTALGYRLI
jgi:hypothetical protein